MAKTDYIIQSSAGFSGQLVTTKKAIAAYAATLGLTPAQVTSLAADADYFAHVLENETVLKNAARQAIAWADIVREGGALPPTGAPVAPVLPTAVPPVAPGVEARFRALVRQMKASTAYNDSIGKALGIEGSEKGEMDQTTITPLLTPIISGGQVQVGWSWQGFGSKLDMIEIHVDRGTGFTLLTYDTTPGYTDTAPFPATPAKWTYKAIYRKGDAQIGQWSAEASIIVGG